MFSTLFSLPLPLVIFVRAKESINFRGFSFFSPPPPPAPLIRTFHYRRRRKKEKDEEKAKGKMPVRDASSSTLTQTDGAKERKRGERKTHDISRELVGAPPPPLPTLAGRGQTRETTVTKHFILQKKGEGQEQLGYFLGSRPFSRRKKRHAKE